MLKTFIWIQKYTDTANIVYILYVEGTAISLTTSSPLKFVLGVDNIVVSGPIFSFAFLSMNIFVEVHDCQNMSKSVIIINLY